MNSREAQWDDPNAPASSYRVHARVWSMSASYDGYIGVYAQTEEEAIEKASLLLRRQYKGFNVDISRTEKTSQTDYAACGVCGVEMKPGNEGCWSDAQNAQGGFYKRIPYGGNGEDTSIPCGDCGVAPFKVHHDGCDQETCPVCRGQFAFCECATGIARITTASQDKTAQYDPLGPATCPACGHKAYSDDPSPAIRSVGGNIFFCEACDYTYDADTKEWASVNETWFRENYDENENHKTAQGPSLPEKELFFTRYYDKDNNVHDLETPSSSIEYEQEAPDHSVGMFADGYWVYNPRFHDGYRSEHLDEDGCVFVDAVDATLKSFKTAQALNSVLAVAKDVARRVREKYEWVDDPWEVSPIDVWDAKRNAESGFTIGMSGGSAAVVWESGGYHDSHDWAVIASFEYINDYPGFLLEPWAGWKLDVFDLRKTSSEFNTNIVGGYCPACQTANAVNEQGNGSLVCTKCAAVFPTDDDYSADLLADRHPDIEVTIVGQTDYPTFSEGESVQADRDFDGETALDSATVISVGQAPTGVPIYTVEFSDGEKSELHPLSIRKSGQHVDSLIPGYDDWKLQSPHDDDDTLYCSVCGEVCDWLGCPQGCEEHECVSLEPDWDSLPGGYDSD